jgi:hypothetical protein
VTKRKTKPSKVKSSMRKTKGKNNVLGRSFTSSH